MLTTGRNMLFFQRPPKRQTGSLHLHTGHILIAVQSCASQSWRMLPSLGWFIERKQRIKVLKNHYLIPPYTHTHIKIKTKTKKNMRHSSGRIECTGNSHFVSFLDCHDVFPPLLLQAARWAPSRHNKKKAVDADAITCENLDTIMMFVS